MALLTGHRGGRAICDWLRASPVFDSATVPIDALPADWLLEVLVERLYADMRDPKAPLAVLAMGFRLLNARSPVLETAFEATCEAGVPASSPSADAIAKAWSAALSQILGELEADLGQRVSS